jgi:hypothetical protein
MAETCTDCGTRERWWYSAHLGPTYCRRCHDSNGYYEYPRPDPDKLAEFFRERVITPDPSGTALDVIARCSYG